MSEVRPQPERLEVPQFQGHNRRGGQRIRGDMPEVSPKEFPDLRQGYVDLGGLFHQRHAIRRLVQALPVGP